MAIYQLVENEDMIGTLIETNDRLVAALDMYDKAVSLGTPTLAVPYDCLFVRHLSLRKRRMR